MDTLGRSERASHIFGVLRNIETQRFHLEVEQAGRGVEDDAVAISLPVPPERQDDPPTFKERRRELDEQEKRLRAKFKALMPDVEALIAQQAAQEAEQRAALAARAEQASAQAAEAAKS